MFGKRKIAMLGAELLGTALLTMATLAITKSNLAYPLFIAATLGITLSVLAFLFHHVSGAFFNPVVTLGMWTLRKIKTIDALVFIIVQMAGAVVGARLFVYLLNQSLGNIAGNGFEWRVLVGEAVGTFILTFGIAAAMYQKYDGERLALTMGGALFLGVLVATIVSNGVLNPAVALGIGSWGRAYIFGPVIGSILGMNLYALLFVPVENRVLITKTTTSKNKK